MVPGTLVPLKKYLSTSYEPDCEFVDGEVVERNFGDYPHSRLQSLLAGYFLNREMEWDIVGAVELRFKVAEGRYLIPDICILREEPDEPVPSRPPLLWIEILSPEDQMPRLERKIEMVLKFGAEYIWVIDPVTLDSFVCTSNSRQQVSDRTLRIPGTEIVVPLDRLHER